MIRGNRAALGAAVSLFALSAALPALAQESADRVVVTGRSLELTLPQELARYGNDLITVDGATLRNRLYIDANSALQMEVPGLYFAPRNGPYSYSDLSLQGSRVGDVLFLVDGVRINNRLYPGTITDTLPANMIERIEVLKGGQSLFFGTQAAGGVINIVTREFSDTFGGQLDAGYDTNDSYHLGGYVRGPLGRGNYVVFASRDESDGITPYSAFQPSATLRRRGYEVTSGGGKIGFDLTEALTFTAQYQHTDAAFDYPNPTLTREASNKRNEEIASARLDYTPNDTAQFFLKAYYHDWDSRYTNIANSVTAPGTFVVNDDNAFWGYEDYGVNALGKFRLHRGLEYLLGYDFQRYNARDDVLLIAPTSEEVHAVAFQARTTDDLIENGAFAAGLRYNDTGGADATVWNVSGRYDLTSSLFVQGQAGTAFNLPSAEQLFAFDPCCAFGNPDLEPEESTNANLSVGGGVARFSWQATAFWREIENLIMDDSSDPAFPSGVYINVDDEVRVRGFEILGQFAITDELTATASYTHTRSRVAGGTAQLNRIPEDQARASLSYETQRWGASLTSSWIGDVWDNVTGAGRVNYGDYIVADVAAHVFVDSDRRHKITARLENVFDREYASRVRSDLTDNARLTGSGERFFIKTLGVPQTLHISYSYAFGG